MAIGRGLSTRGRKATLKPRGTGTIKTQGREGMLDQVKDVVRDLLERQESTRDSDSELIARVWAREYVKLLGRDLNDSERQLFRSLSRGDFTAAESISRCRRKWQEEDPSLRGENYQKRQFTQTEIQQELRGW